jgi:hypothetical protein
VRGQSDSSASSRKPKFSFSGFLDVFYAYDFNKPGNPRQDFLYNHNRHNEVNLNLGLLKAALKHSRYRANLALQTGTYVADNYATEPALLSYIHEANAGLAIDKEKRLWLDCGIMASHIGFESALSKEGWTLSRSLLAENSPYYYSAARLSLQRQLWEFAAIVCNGWQRITRVSGNSLHGFGTQVKYQDLSGLVFNWSTFAGTTDPDRVRRMRYFNNFYAQYAFNKKTGLQVGFDLGLQQTSKGSSAYHNWYSPVLILRHAFTNKWAAAMRAEYYNDKNEVIVSTATGKGFECQGFSFNIDHSPVKDITWRSEIRWLYSDQKVLRNEHGFSNDDLTFLSSIAVSF